MTKLRSEAEMTQAAVAQGLTVSPARVSRIESGEVELTPDEMAEYLRVLGTEKAAAFGRFLTQEWQYLPRPDFEHPDLQTIRDAEEVLTGFGAPADINGSTAQSSRGTARPARRNRRRISRWDFRSLITL